MKSIAHLLNMVGRNTGIFEKVLGQCTALSPLTRRSHAKLEYNYICFLPRPAPSCSTGRRGAPAGQAGQHLGQQTWQQGYTQSGSTTRTQLLTARLLSLHLTNSHANYTAFCHFCPQSVAGETQTCFSHMSTTAQIAIAHDFTSALNPFSAQTNFLLNLDIFSFITNRLMEEEEKFEKHYLC